MRDPQAAIRFDAEQVVRTLRQPLEDAHFLRSSLALDWCRQGRLVAYRIEDERTVVAERLPFITHPYEWCDEQLFTAAQFTLDLQREAVAARRDLKDASAWNVIFQGTRPLFCDLMSFEDLRLRKWWALGQFSRHFLGPLAVAAAGRLRSHQAFLMWRDGMPPGCARELLGARRFLTRQWPIVAGSDARPVTDAGSRADSLPAELEAVSRFRQGLDTALVWILNGSRPGRGRAPRASAWSDYASQRPHYVDDSADRKRSAVDGWIRRLAPTWVTDLGCNTGEFSRMALEVGAQVIAIDADHDSVQAAFRSAVAHPRLHPLIASLDDLPAGRGWRGQEHEGLATRLEKHSDLVLMLALLHHLVVAAAVPLDAVARFAAHCTKRWLIVELIGERDPQLRLLCAQHHRSPAEFGMARQRAAFIDAGFAVEAELSLEPTDRTLLLMRQP